MKTIAKKLVRNIVVAYLTDEYNKSDEKVLKGAITKVLQKI